MVINSACYPTERESNLRLKQVMCIALPPILTHSDNSVIFAFSIDYLETL